VLAAQRPCVLVGHWPCFYANDRIGFRVLKEVKRRLDAYDPDRTQTVWMKNSEIGHYWMARELSDLQVEEAASRCDIRIRTKFPTHDFTLAIRDLPARRVQVAGRDMRPVGSRRDFRSGTFLVEGNQTFVAFDLGTGDTRISAIRVSETAI